MCASSSSSSCSKTLTAFDTLIETDAGSAGGTFVRGPCLASYSVNEAISSKFTTTTSLNILFSTCSKLTVGTPTKNGNGASSISNISFGNTGMYGNCQVNGNINAVITSATMATCATFVEWISMRHSVSAAANRRVNPSAPSSRHADAIAAPCGSGGSPVSGVVITCNRSPSRNGIEQCTIPSIGFEKLTMRLYKSFCNMAYNPVAIDDDDMEVDSMEVVPLLFVTTAVPTDPPPPPLQSPSLSSIIAN